MNLELNDEERLLLQQILQGRMAELREEVRHARITTFREELKQKEDLLRGVMDKLDRVESQPVGSSSAVLA